MMPVISLVGRPNVGKSTLFNRLSKSRQALVSDLDGLTRDRQYATISLDNHTQCKIIDTGGLTDSNNILDNAIRKQVLSALEESNIIYFIVSTKDGITGLDLSIVKQLRKFKQHLILVCNKSEGVDTSTGLEFYELGLGKPMFISAEHNQGIAELVALSSTLIPTNLDNENYNQPTGIVIAVLGRPNVGKSTLINRILGENRLLAIDLPGTTRDSIYIPFEYRSQQYTLIDTAGIRRKRSVHQKIEKFSIVKAIDALEKSHLAILLIDAQEGITEQDATLLGMVHEKGRALLIVINKWDGLSRYQKQEVKRKLEIKLSFINYASIHYISALHGLGVEKLFSPIIKSYKNAGAQFSTALLNKVLQQANRLHQSPIVRGRRIKLKYAHQSGVFPPTFTLHGNHVENIPTAYERYLKNFFIKTLSLTNTPVKLEYKSGENPFKNRKNKLSARQINKKRRLMKFVKKKH